MERVTQNEKGFSLLEAIIAIGIMAIMMMMTTQSMMGAYSLATSNQLRDEALRLSGEALTEVRNTPYSSLSVGTTTTNIDRQIRNYNVTFTVVETVSNAVSGIAYSVDVDVQWTDRGNNINYLVTTIVGDK